MEEKEIRRLMISIGKKLVGENLVQGTLGNLSIRLDENHMLITPSGSDYDSLKEEDFVKVNIRTLEYSGHKPSTERKIHAKIYLVRPDVNAVIHTHSLYCSVFAAAHKEISVGNVVNIGSSICVGKYALPSTDKLTDNTISALGNNTACIMANHGMFVCGKNLEETYKSCCAVENRAKEIVNSL